MSIPVGGIIWSDAPTIPAGWNICDGSNGTPDLRHKFIYGASADGEVGLTGGADSHDHTQPNTNGSGAHGHSVTVGLTTVLGTASCEDNSSGAAYLAPAGHEHGKSGINVSADGDHDHTVGDTGLGNLIPESVYLYYIMRIF